jgi:hypothetical protein
MLKPLGILILLIAISYIFVSTVTATPKEAIQNCFTDSQRNFDVYSQKFQDPDQKQVACTDQKGEIASLKQCINNVYGKYGRYQSALALKRLNLGKSDPLAQIIDDHNQSCSSYPESKVE